MRNCPIWICTNENQVGAKNWKALDIAYYVEPLSHRVPGEVRESLVVNDKNPVLFDKDIPIWLIPMPKSGGSYPEIFLDTESTVFVILIVHISITGDDRALLQVRRGVCRYSGSIACLRFNLCAVWVDESLPIILFGGAKGGAHKIVHNEDKAENQRIACLFDGLSRLILFNYSSSWYIPSFILSWVLCLSNHGDCSNTYFNPHKWEPRIHRNPACVRKSRLVVLESEGKFRWVPLVVWFWISSFRSAGCEGWSLHPNCCSLGSLSSRAGAGYPSND